MSKPKTKKGRLRIYLGSASGVGKSFTLLKDAIAYRDRGRKIAIAALGHVDRTAICDLANGLPRLQDGGNLDLDAIKNSDYDMIIIDDLALTNSDGARNKSVMKTCSKLFILEKTSLPPSTFNI
jgi:two-component system sensor histidine kinase KdpD